MQGGQHTAYTAHRLHQACNHCLTLHRIEVLLPLHCAAAVCSQRSFLKKNERCEQARVAQATLSLLR